MPDYWLTLRILEPAAIDGYSLFNEAALMLVIHSRVPNTYDPRGEKVDVSATYPLPPLHLFDGPHGMQAFREFLRRSVHHRMAHEADEWLKRDGVMVWDPHANDQPMVERAGRPTGA
jgi:hypothetical protein